MQNFNHNSQRHVIIVSKSGVSWRRRQHGDFCLGRFVQTVHLFKSVFLSKPISKSSNMIAMNYKILFGSTLDWNWYENMYY